MFGDLGLGGVGLGLGFADFEVGLDLGWVGVEGSGAKVSLGHCRVNLAT